MSNRGILFRRSIKQTLIDSGIRVGETVLATDTLELGTRISDTELKWYKVSDMSDLLEVINDEDAIKGHFLAKGDGDFVEFKRVDGLPAGGMLGQYVTIVQGTNGLMTSWGYVLPDKGTTGQILAKASTDDFDVEWIDAPSGGGGSVLGPTVIITPGEVNVPGESGGGAM